MSDEQTSERSRPTVDVVVVTYSPGEALDAFLQSIRDVDHVGRIILADNGSVDGSVERAAADEPQVELLRTGGNLGYGSAVNAGVGELGVQNDDPDRFVLICNPDVVLEAGSVPELLAAARRWPRAGAVGPLILTPEGQVYPSARDQPSIGRGIGHALCGWWWPSNPWTRSYRRQDESIVEREAGWLSGACLLVRRTAFEQIGGFDHHYFMYFEDVDFGDRLRESGWQNIYAPSAKVMHTGGHATKRHSVEMTRAHHRSAFRYLARRYPRWWHWPMRAVLRVGLAARAWLAVRNSAVAAGAPLDDAADRDG